MVRYLMLVDVEFEGITAWEVGLTYNETKETNLGNKPSNLIALSTK